MCDSITDVLIGTVQNFMHTISVNKVCASCVGKSTIFCVHEFFQCHLKKLNNVRSFQSIAMELTQPSCVYI